MYRGLTWDHPRGRHALERAAEDAFGGDDRPLISWDVHPLEGFESTPIEELAERYDVIVLDHPHLGDALAHGSLQPLDDLFGRALVDRLAAGCVGPSFTSYRLDGHLWALPLDAATQVAVRVPELLETAPETWVEVEALDVPVALSLAGPHAFLSFASLCVALGEEPRVVPGEGLVSESVGAEAFGILARLAAHQPAGADAQNPIGLLDRMQQARDIAYIPLVYGYVTNATGPGALAFEDAPAATPGGRRGSTIGGTGIALSARCHPDEALVDHLAGLLDPDLQAGFIPANDGQPSLRSAWTDDAVNAASGDFYRNTLATIDDSWVRPRVPGYIPFQSAASAVLREALTGGADPVASVARINTMYDALAAAPALSGGTHR
ncbi:type 2 periplasmic-binding domain-containing protein [Agromyces mangrovi Wang et al. 2018]|uniref:hypothetical protein n=1 Tax=Agromyces mangrovi TaxID=1858653 RepID=UPI002574680C|nr:hypothetical protein [Agromyces mangrovi]BDZ64066.1 membrane protein [Agromyces mangrovi]